MADAPDRGWPEENDQFAIEAGFESWGDWIEHLETHTKAGEPRKTRRKICGARIPRGYEGRTDVDTPCCLVAGAASMSANSKPTGHKGHGRCGSHGGLSLVHAESPRSKYYLTGRMAELDQLVETELAVRKEAHVLELLIAADLESLPEDVLTSRVLSTVLTKLSDEIKKAEGTGDYSTVDRIAHSLRSGLDDATLYWAKMDQIRRNIDQKRRLIDTHVRQLAREHGPVNWYDVAMIMEEFRRDVRVVVDEFITDPAKRSQAIKMLQAQTQPGRGPNTLSIVP